MKQVEKIESNLNDFLLRDVVFLLENGKSLKKGKLVLFKFKEFHFVFTLKNDKGENRVYEIPYPFSWERSSASSLQFSYDIDNFTLVDTNLYYRIKVLDNSNANKLYNSYLVLSAI